MRATLEQIELLETIKNSPSALKLNAGNSPNIEYLLEKGLISGAKTPTGYENLKITAQGNDYLSLLESYIADIFKPDPLFVNMPWYLKILFAILVALGVLATLAALAHNLGFNI